MNHTYAIVGNWSFRPVPKGFHIFRYDAQTGALDRVETVREDISAGCVCPDAAHGMLYVNNESGDRPGCLGGGGSVLCFSLDAKTGHASQLCERPSLAPNPSYFWLDAGGRYALVSHHCARGYATKLRRGANGELSCETVFDDAALVLFRIGPDGMLEAPCDACVTPGAGAAGGAHAISHQHCVAGDPTGALFLVCDKGTDQIHAFRLDRENGRILHLFDNSVEAGCAPRYGLFHPTLPVFYENNERQCRLFVYGYDTATGVLTKRSEAPLLQDPAAYPSGTRLEPSDLLLSPDGKHLYATVRGAEVLSIFDVAADGSLALRANVSCGGRNPRGLCLSPEGKYLYCANVETGVRCFSVGADGGLTLLPGETEANCPGCIRFITL
jgi:6-phosphogluconolactonase